MSFSFPPFAKAIAAAVVGAAVPAVASAATTGGVDQSSAVQSVIGLVVSGMLTYLVPNGKPKASVNDLVVTVKTDLEKFAAAFVAGVPALVKSAAEAAVTPEPTAAPAILGKALVEQAPEAPAAPAEGGVA